MFLLRDGIPHGCDGNTALTEQTTFPPLTIQVGTGKQKEKGKERESWIPAALPWLAWSDDVDDDYDVQSEARKVQ